MQRTYHYDYQDRLITTQYPDGSGTSDTYVYNIFNSRTKLTLNGTQWSFRRDGLSATAPVLQDSTSSTTNTYVPGVSQKQGSTKKYMGVDRMGSVSHEFDASSVTTYKAKYDAFGVYIPDTGSSTNRFGFAAQWGYQTDPTSGLQLLGNRYYDPSIGRFITRDPIKDGRNWFAYCENNPLKKVDPDGLYWFAGATGGVIVPGASLSGSVHLVYDPVTGDVGLAIGVGGGHGMGISAPAVGVGAGADTTTLTTGTTTGTAVGAQLGPASFETYVDENGNATGAGVGAFKQVGGGVFTEKRVTLMINFMELANWLEDYPLDTGPPPVISSGPRTSRDYNARFYH